MRRKNNERSLRVRATAALLLLVLLVTSVAGLPASAAEAVTLTEHTVEHSDRRYPWLSSTTETYTYDFTETDILTYSRDEKLSTASLRTNMVFADGKLSCKPGKTFSFGSAVFLGDDYGLWGGELSFALSLTGGSLSVGTRLEKKAANPTATGLWFTLRTDGLTIAAPDADFSVSLPLTVPSGEATLRVEDTVDSVALYWGDTLLCRVLYTSTSGELTVQDADGNAQGSVASTDVNAAGYFTLWADDLGGSIDDLSFTHTEVTDTTELSGDHTIDYSSWVATDDRDRTTPTADTTGGVRADKQVGLFYFLCWTGDDDSETPRDITAKYLDLGLDGLKEYLADESNAGGYYWAEPYFGYYNNVDTWVYRKHAYMLEAAGVDFIYLDMTNGASYPEGVVALFDTWLELRREGQDTPQICVFTGGSTDADMQSLRGNIYSEAGWGKYGELFYQYEGKPLILADRDQCSDSTKAYLDEHFTVRNCWAWQDATNTWSWMQEYKIVNGEVKLVNGGLGRNEFDEFEQLALCVGHHPTTNKGRSYANTVFPDVNNDFGFSLDSGSGAGFEAQFEAVMRLDPDMILITGWNEWTAGLVHNWNPRDLYAGTRGCNFQMVDLFNTEYSRDAEPMRLRQGDTVGFGDNYYYQMTTMIRKYKGMGNAPVATGQGTISLDDADAWSAVGPEYRDSVGDTELRHSQSFFTNTVYVNNTGRNDFDTAQVSQDADYLYFTVTTVHDIVTDDGSNWMNLFLNTDGDSATGWEGYDFVLNRARDGHYVSIESLSDGWSGTPVGQALYTVSGNRMTLRVSKAALGLSGSVESFLFKWADNSTTSGNVMEFMDLGDTAPNDRFAYLYQGKAGDTSDVAYALSAGELRDETTPLPGMQVPSDNETDTDTETEPETDTTAGDTSATAPETDTAATEPDDTPNAPARHYSTALKVCIVATGAVLGACAYVLITLPRGERKKE